MGPNRSNTMVEFIDQVKSDGTFEHSIEEMGNAGAEIQSISDEEEEEEKLNYDDDDLEREEGNDNDGRSPIHQILTLNFCRFGRRANTSKIGYRWGKQRSIS